MPVAECINRTQPLETAVLFLVFNRLDTTRKVFEAIKQVKPPRLYIAADGARENKEGEAFKVQTVRTYLMESIDWDCAVKTLFREENLGCKDAVTGAFNWFFEHEEQGIILEDDCLPSQSFFWFCEELLEKYKNDDRVGQISGFNKFGDFRGSSYSYEFLTGGPIWGWATWRRVAKDFNGFYNDDVDLIFKSMVGFTDDKIESMHIKENLKLVKEGHLSTWDYHWGAMLKANSRLSIVSSSNLINNLGFGDDATHTFGDFDNPKLNDLDFDNFTHPKYISANKSLSKLQAETQVMSFFKKLLKRIKGGL